MMMKNKLKRVAMAASLAIVSLSIGSCRQEGDELLNNTGYDYLGINDSDNDPSNSFAAEFDILWNAINSNYVFWDIETIDWDSAYDATLPKMKEFDQRKAAGEQISNEEFREIYENLLGNLHDGHAGFAIKNISTGDYLKIIPSVLRNKTRKDYKINLPWNLDAYDDQIIATKLATSDDYEYLSNRIKNIYVFLINNIAEYEKNGIETEQDAEMYNYIKNAADDLKNTFNGVDFPSTESMTNAYNDWCARYADLGMEPIVRTIKDDLKMQSAIFSDGIAYLRISDFLLTPYFTAKLQNCTEDDRYFINQLIETWRLWFDSIQQLAKAGSLKGVIIDVRSNGGGYCDDYQCIYGALIESKDAILGTTKMKNGTGRLDYGPSFPLLFPTYSEPHEAITQPIVVLANCNTSSMAEATVASAKIKDNGTFIGTQTWGGTGLLVGDDNSYNAIASYAGTFGIAGKTPIFGYLPYQNNTYEKVGCVEGVGITPDIEVDYDKNLYEATGHDSQLDAALEYIRRK